MILSGSGGVYQGMLRGAVEDVGGFKWVIGPYFLLFLRLVTSW